MRGQRFKGKKKKRNRKLRNGKRRVMESIRCREAIPDGQRKRGEESSGTRIHIDATDSKSKALREENNTPRDVTLYLMSHPSLG